MVAESPNAAGGSKSLQTDAARGKWTTPNDFICACLGCALRLDVFIISWNVLVHMGISVIVPYLITWALYVLPLTLLQAYMGQFSSRGFIAAFRISPVFKIMGYISLAVNLTMLSYYSLFAAIPLLYLINSFHATLPWSCEAFRKSWAQFPQPEFNICHVIPGDSIARAADTANRKFIPYQVPSVLFFRSYFENINFFTGTNTNFNISWELLACSALIWFIIGILVYKYCSAEKLGKLLRYLIAAVFVLLLLCLARFLFLPGVASHLDAYFHLNLRNIRFGFSSIPMYIMCAFGPGWGAIVSLASFNALKTNIMRSSWIIGLGQMCIFMAFSLMLFALDTYFAGLISPSQLPSNVVYTQTELSLYLASGSAIATMEWANLWSILYYTMLTSAALVVMIIQMNSILVSLFDEYEFLRSRKTQVTFGLIGIMALCSIYFCSSSAILHFTAFTVDALILQCGLNLLLLFVVLWIYGRVRLQRDMKFMLSQPFASWKIHIIRFMTPLYICFILLIVCFLAYHGHLFTFNVINIIATSLLTLTWLIIPGYVVYYILKATGPLKARFQHCTKPVDWHPAAVEDCQQYENVLADKQTESVASNLP